MRPFAFTLVCLLFALPLQAADISPNVALAVSAAEHSDADRERDAHDKPAELLLYWVEEEGGWPAIDADSFLKQLHTALKPGGRLLIVDHSAKAGSGKAPAQTLHRIDEEFAKQDITSHAFELEKAWDGYRDFGDDRTKMVFDPAIRGRTDRFTHLSRRR